MCENSHGHGFHLTKCSSVNNSYNEAFYLALIMQGFIMDIILIVAVSSHKYLVVSCAAAVFRRKHHGHVTHLFLVHSSFTQSPLFNTCLMELYIQGFNIGLCEAIKLKPQTYLLNLFSGTDSWLFTVH